MKNLEHMRFEDFNHMDVLWTEDADTRINAKVIEYLAKIRKVRVAASRQ